MADRDLDRIWRHIAADSSTAANRVEDELHSAMKLLAEFPGMGHRRQDAKDDRHLFWGVYSYLIVYRIEGNTLLVVRVVHGARDLRRVLRRHLREE